MSRALYKCRVLRFDRSPNPSGIHPLSPELYDKLRCCRQYRLQRLSGISPLTRKRGRRGGRGGRHRQRQRTEEPNFQEDQRGPHTAVSTAVHEMTYRTPVQIWRTRFPRLKYPKKKTAPRAHPFLGLVWSQLVEYHVHYTGTYLSDIIFIQS